MLKKRKKGFTLIELIVVIAVLGILVLLAAPKFLGYVEEAKLAQIKNDSKAHESFIEVKRVNKDDYYKGWRPVSPETLKGQIKSKNLYNKTGLLTNQNEISEDTLYYEIPKKTVNTKLKGKFIYSEEGTVYYNGTGGKMTGDDDDTYENYRWMKYETYSMKDSPFIFALADVAYNPGGEVGNSDYGYWHYIGNEEVVVIPDTIQGYPVTSYYKMFAKHWDFEPETIPKKIISTNKNITNMAFMFDGFGYENLYEHSNENFNPLEKSLDLSEFDTSRVTTMQSMFEDTELLYLDISNFDTSNVEIMNAMFEDSRASLVDFEVMKYLMTLDEEDVTDEDLEKMYTLNFNTSKVTDMDSMFKYMDVEKVYVESFDTSNVEYMQDMFKGASIYDGDSFKHFDTSKVWNMENMFDSATIYDVKLDLSTWDTSNVDDMDSMFAYMTGAYDWDSEDYSKSKLENLYLNNFNVDLAYVGYMFSNAKVNNVYIDDQNAIQLIKNTRDGKPAAGITFH